MGGSIERILSRESYFAERCDALDKLKIGIVGISKGAGVSFITGCLARYLANTGKHRPVVVELGHGSLYDSYGMDRRFAGRCWFRFYEALAENNSIRGIKNMDEGINWILITPDEEELQLSFEQKLTLISHARGDVILCDLSGGIDADEGILRSMDQIIAVIDPMPSKMLSGYKALGGIKVLETEKGAVIYAVNKMNPGVNRRQMMDFIKIKKPVIFPLINPELIYTAEYNCRIPYVIGEVKTAIQSPLAEIASALFL